MKVSIAANSYLEPVAKIGLTRCLAASFAILQLGDGKNMLQNSVLSFGRENTFSNAIKERPEQLLWIFYESI